MKTITRVAATLLTAIALTPAHALEQTSFGNPNLIDLVRASAPLVYLTTAGVEQACNTSLLNGYALLKRTDGCLDTQMKVVRDPETDRVLACTATIAVYKAKALDAASENGACVTTVPLYRAPEHEVLGQGQ